MDNKLQFNQHITNITIQYQLEIINRLKLYDFATSAIKSYSRTRQNELEGYDFTDFNTKFSLVDFKKNKSIKSIHYKEMVKTGNKFIENELVDSVFILNTSTFETWALELLKERYIFDKKLIYSDIKNIKDNDSYGKVDIQIIKEASTLNSLWERIVDKYVRHIANENIVSIMKKVLKIYSVPYITIPESIIFTINEMFLFRNIIVHNQKITNEEYTRIVKNNPRFQSGQKISISGQMLFEQADNMLKFMQDLRKNI